MKRIWDWIESFAFSAIDYDEKEGEDFYDAQNNTLAGLVLGCPRCLGFDKIRVIENRDKNIEELKEFLCCKKFSCLDCYLETPWLLSGKELLETVREWNIKYLKEKEIRDVKIKAKLWDIHCSTNPDLKEKNHAETN